MIKEEDVLAALDKPRAVYSLQQRLDPSNKSTDALQELRGSGTRLLETLTRRDTQNAMTGEAPSSQKLVVTHRDNQDAPEGSPHHTLLARQPALHARHRRGMSGFPCMNCEGRLDYRALCIPLTSIVVKRRWHCPSRQVCVAQRFSDRAVGRRYNAPCRLSDN